MLYSYSHVIMSGNPAALEVIYNVSLSLAFISNQLQGNIAAFIRPPLLTFHF